MYMSDGQLQSLC